VEIVFEGRNWGWGKGTRGMIEGVRVKVYLRDLAGCVQSSRSSFISIHQDSSNPFWKFLPLGIF
jgi:hypothetical protein